ncbi:MAG: hypothetical protein PVG81_05850 [Desulfobacterales bacterium]
MSTRKKKKRHVSRKPAPTSSKRRFPVIWVVLGSVVLAIAAGIFLYYLLYAESRQTTATTSGQSSSKKAMPTLMADQFRNLIGRWRRVDGRYIIDIRRIGANGQMDATYYNPKSIHVSRAEVSLNDGELSIFIELKDVGYPGSAYTLSYHPRQDILSGVYF